MVKQISQLSSAFHGLGHQGNTEWYRSALIRPRWRGLSRGELERRPTSESNPDDEPLLARDSQYDLEVV